MTSSIKPLHQKRKSVAIYQERGKRGDTKSCKEHNKIDKMYYNF
jgi:uncharacterized radical SAM superfamily Fe-S cluster-containing enzyme